MAVTNLVSEAALALLGAQSLFSTLLVAAYRRGLPRPEIPGSEPNVAVILPVRGERNLDRFLPLLRAQEYRRYRIIASVESADDPAFSLLRAAETEPGAPIETTVAGLARNAGQKVWNLLAALECLRPEDDIVAFIDADTLPTPLWLPRLVAVIVNSGRPVATGYRWMTPADDRWSSCCLAAANASIAALPRGVLPMTIVWGGSVAMKRETLEAIAIEDVWRGAISDDAQMSEALRRSGLVATRRDRLSSCRRSPAPGASSWRSASDSTGSSTSTSRKTGRSHSFSSGPRRSVSPSPRLALPQDRSSRGWRSLSSWRSPKFEPGCAAAFSGRSGPISAARATSGGGEPNDGSARCGSSRTPSARPARRCPARSTGPAFATASPGRRT
jgi:hypothetical protein